MTKNNSKLNFINARLLAVQTLYAHMMNHEDWDKLMSWALLGELGGKVLVDNQKTEEVVDLPPADAGLYTRIVQAYRDNESEIESALQTALSEHIAFNRLEPTFLCIMKAGLAEFYAQPETDAPIIINEYVDLTRSFFDGSEVKIANAILDRFAKIIRGNEAC